MKTLDFNNYDEIKSVFKPKAIDTDNLKEWYDKDVISTKISDDYSLVYIVLDPDVNDAKTWRLITLEDALTWGVTPLEIHNDAIINDANHVPRLYLVDDYIAALKYGDFRVGGTYDLEKDDLYGLIDLEEGDTPGFIVTYGAACYASSIMARPDALKTIAEGIGGGFYIMALNGHTLRIGKDNIDDLDFYLKLARDQEKNRSKRDGEYLSSKLEHYDPKTGRLENAEKWAAKVRKKERKGGVWRRKCLR